MMKTESAARARVEMEKIKFPLQKQIIDLFLISARPQKNEIVRIKGVRQAHVCIKALRL